MTIAGTTFDRGREAEAATSRLPTPARIGLAVPLYLLVIAAASNASTVVGQRFGISLHVTLVGLCTLALGLGIVARLVSPRMPPVVLLFAIAVVSMAPAVTAARDAADALPVLLELVKDLWFLVVIVLLARAVFSPSALTKVIVGTMSLVAAMTAVNAFVFGGAVQFGGFAVVSDALGVGATTARHQGPFLDPNFFGRVLALTFPLALALFLQSWEARRGWGVATWTSSAVILCLGIYLTQSRGAMLAAVVGLVVWALLTGRGTRRSLLFLPVVGAALALVPGVGTRLASLADLTPEPFVERDGSIVERAAALRVMYAIFADNPTLGVGPGNTGNVWRDYTGAGGGGITRQVAPHNLYLQIAAETGILGVIGWLTFLGGLVVLALLHVLANPPGDPRSMRKDRILGAGLAGAFCAWTAASAFLHLADLRVLLLVVAVVGIMQLRLPAPEEVRTGPPVVGPRAWVPVAAVVATLALIAVAAPRVARTDVWVASVPMTLVPTPGADGSVDPYRQQIVSDRTTIATYATVVSNVGASVLADRPDFDLLITGSGDEAVLDVEVWGPDRDEAERLADEVAERAGRFIERQEVLATLAVTREGAVESTAERRWIIGPR